MDLRTYILTAKISDPHYTSKKLAEKIGVHQNVVSLWASKKRVPDAKYVYLILKATNGKVALEDWITEENK